MEINSQSQLLISASPFLIKTRKLIVDSAGIRRCVSHPSITPSFSSCVAGCVFLHICRFVCESHCEYFTVLWCGCVVSLSLSLCLCLYTPHQCVVIAALRERIRSKRLFIYQRYFREDQYHRHDTRCTLVPGQLPSLNLPTKSFPPSSILTKPRESFNNLQLKRALLSKEVPDKPLECYKSFSEFNQRMKSLQLVGWQFSVNDTVAHL